MPAQHPHALAGAVVAVLMGFGITAFGIAPLAPDASRMPRRVVTEMVPSENTIPQLEALASHLAGAIEGLRAGALDRKSVV